MLTVHTEYLSHENLASYHVGTPDPKLFCPTIGQRLILSWNVPKTYSDLHIKITIRFRNKEQIENQFCLDRLQGIYIFPLLDENYLEKGGILTYKVELYSDGVLIEEWLHQLWKEQIQINNNLSYEFLFFEIQEILAANDKIFPKGNSQSAHVTHS